VKTFVRGTAEKLLIRMSLHMTK